MAINRKSREWVFMFDSPTRWSAAGRSRYRLRPALIESRKDVITRQRVY